MFHYSSRKTNSIFPILLSSKFKFFHYDIVEKLANSNNIRWETVQVTRSLGSILDSEYIYGQGPNKPPTALKFGPKLLASKLYQLSPTKVNT